MGASFGPNNSVAYGWGAGESGWGQQMSQNMRALDALLSLDVISDAVNTPPSSPNPGDRYIIGPSPTGAWAGNAGKIARFIDGGWEIYEHSVGRRAFVQSNGGLYRWTGAVWTPIGGGGGGSASWGGISGNLNNQSDLRGQLDDMAKGSMSSGLIKANVSPLMTALTTTTLRIHETPGAYFESLINGATDPIVTIAQQDFPLSSIPGLTTDGVYVRQVYIDSLGNLTFEGSNILVDPTRFKLGTVYVNKVGASVTFLEGTAGPLSAIPRPHMAQTGELLRSYIQIAADVDVYTNTNLTFRIGTGYVAGEAINWGDTTNVNRRPLPAQNPCQYRRIYPTSVSTATQTNIVPNQYWDGAALAAVGNGEFTVQRFFIGALGLIGVQVGEAKYASLSAASAAVWQAPFTDVLTTSDAVEVGRLVIRGNATNLSDSTQAIYYPIGSGSGGAEGGSYQPLDATLTALAGLATGNDTMPYFNGTDTAAQTALTALARTLIGKTTEAEMRSILNALAAAPSSISVATYGNLNSGQWGTLAAGIYTITGLGSEFSNTPFTLTPAATYVMVVHHATSASVYVDDIVLVSDSDASNADVGMHTVRSGVNFANAATNGWRISQRKLVSGTSIKTINGISVLGSGNIDVSGGGSTPTDISISRSSTTVTVESSTGQDGQIGAATGSLAGVMASADKVKLDGVAIGATANQTDAHLLNRANHTGTQAASTISDLQEAVQDITGAFLVAGANVTITYDDVNNQLVIASSGGGGGSNNWSAVTGGQLPLNANSFMTVTGSVSLPSAMNVGDFVLFKNAKGSSQVVTNAGYTINAEFGSFSTSDNIAMDARQTLYLVCVSAGVLEVI